MWALGIIMSIDKIHKLVESGMHQEALERIRVARKEGVKDPILFLFEALANYDAKNDLECLELLNKFISSTNGHVKYDYAFFTAGVCLMNLGLPNEAKFVFNKVPNHYPGIKQERNSAELTAKVASKAKKVFAAIMEQENA